MTPEHDFTGRLVFLHGFTQTHHHWHDGAHLVADRLSHRTTLAFVDLPGHGLSDADRTGILRSDADLIAVGGAGTYIGSSMGGRFGLVAALAGRPEVERRRLDHERADHLEQFGVDRFLDEWRAAPMFAGLPPDPDGLEHRRRNAAGGLAHSLRTCGTGDQGSLWRQLDRVTIPVLVIAGAHDTKFSALGRRMVEALPNATFASIPDAGHAAHTEQPAVTADSIATWLTATDHRPPTTRREQSVNTPSAGA